MKSVKSQQKSRQDGDIWGLLLLVKFEKRRGGISAVAFLELPGRVRQWQRACVRRGRRALGTVFSLVRLQCSEQCRAQNQGPGCRRQEEQLSLCRPRPCGTRRVQLLVFIKWDKGKLGFWILLSLHFETTKDAWELHFWWWGGKCYLTSA